MARKENMMKIHFARAARNGAGIVSVLLLVSVQGAEPFPNPSMIHRYVGADTNETWQGVANNGIVWKRGSGTVTMPAPALNGGGQLNVAEGDVVLNLDAPPAVPTLPDYLAQKAKLWLDPATNIVTEGDLVTTWFDRREPNIAGGGSSYVYPYASSAFQWASPTPSGDRRPTLVAGGTALNGTYLDFGAYGAAGSKNLCITNTGLAGGVVFVRELFAVFARRTGMSYAGFTMFSLCRGDVGQNRPVPAWVGSAALQLLWGTTAETRADKGSTRLDRNPVWGGNLSIRDYAWHVVGTRVPNVNNHCQLNQIGFDRDLTSYSGGFCLAEVIMFEQRLSEFDRMRVEDYLWKKWMGARQTSVGALAIATNSCVTATTSSDVAGALSGGGTFVKRGSGTATLVDDGFSGTVELAAGGIRSEGLPIAVAAAGQKFAAGAQGIVTRLDDAAAGTVVKSGRGYLAVASLPADAKVQVENGGLRIAPPEPEEKVALPALFTNANFEAYNVVDVWNAGGGSASAPAVTNGNWVFDRRNRSGSTLVAILNKSTYHSGSWQLQPEDTYGLGYEGNNLLYICRGSATGTFVLPSAGLYRLVFSVGARNTTCLKPMRIKVDGTPLGLLTSFNEKSFMRYEVALPYLSAGAHEVAFSDEPDDPNSVTTILLDDLKVVPVRVSAEAPVSVAIANPGFEEPLLNITNTATTFKPSVSSCVGWTTPTESTEGFAQGMIARRWFDGIISTAAETGILAWPDEMADGFLCAQLFSSKAFSQTVTLPSSGRYRLTFHLAKRCGLSPQLVTVTLGGRVVKKVWVRHDDWRQYEAVFDVTEGGDSLLAFAGSVAGTSGNVFSVGSAWLDDVALERVAEAIPVNLVANGDFESTGGWTFHGACTNLSDQTFSVPEAAPQGADCACVGGSTSDASLRQVVTFPAAGRYELSFRTRRCRTNMFDDDKISQFFVKVGDDEVWRRNLVQHENECVIRQPFTVPAAGTYLLDFHTELQEGGRGYALVDDVAIVAAPMAAQTDLENNIPETLELEIAAGATLNLDFDGTAEVRRVTFAGRSVVGDISHTTCPIWVMGRGVLHVTPRGTTLVVR